MVTIGTTLTSPRTYPPPAYNGSHHLYVPNGTGYIAGLTVGGDLTVSGNYNLAAADIPNISANKITSGKLSLSNSTVEAVYIDTTVVDGQTRDAIKLYENDAKANGRAAISWYNGNHSYYKARLWTEVGGGYNETRFGIDVANNAREVATRLEIVNGNTNISGNLSVGGDFIHIDGKEAIDGNDGWLRLNQNGDFTSGTHIPGKFYVAGNLQVGGQYQNGKAHIHGSVSKYYSSVRYFAKAAGVQGTYGGNTAVHHYTVVMMLYVWNYKFLVIEE